MFANEKKQNKIKDTSYFFLTHFSHYHTQTHTHHTHTHKCVNDLANSTILFLCVIEVLQLLHDQIYTKLQVKYMDNSIPYSIAVLSFAQIICVQIQLLKNI